jgi:hypothetical protein
MNTPQQDLEQALAQLAGMYRALCLICEQVLPAGAHNFSLLAEGTVEHIERLEATVMDLGGRHMSEEKRRDRHRSALGANGQRLGSWGDPFALGTEREQALRQMLRMHRILRGLRLDVLPKSGQQFRIMAEGPLEEIRRLEASIRELPGLLRSAEDRGLPS